MSDPKRMGAVPSSDGSTRFRVWAPHARKLAVRVVGPRPRVVPLERGERGIFEARVPDVPAGADYLYVLDEKRERPDPCSRYQPHGVHGPSRVVAADGFAWSDGAWKGIALPELVLYELHVGTFTPEGTFEGAIAKLDHLVDLGITSIELMPVAQFPGDRNWGYDGAYLYAPQASYGGPDGLRRLVDACHARGLAVTLDVVYNHLGPEGNYLGEYAPYFTFRHRTPWGDAINFDGAGSDEVRAFFRENALEWLTDFHVDALRFDAVHSIFDMSARHFLEETAAAFHERARSLGRQGLVIAESDLNDVRVIRPAERGGLGFDAQWGDDFHHAVMASLIQARDGYFADFGGVADVAKAIAEGFVYDGQPSSFRGRSHGNSAAREPGHKLVVFLENHDQIANARHGKRLARVASPPRQRLAAALLFAHPGVPMLFMGQEFCETAPFDFFTSHSDEALIEAVRRGRREEHREMGLSDPPDPQAESTYRAAKIDWALAAQPAGRAALDLYRDLLALRRRYPALSNGRKDLTTARWSESPRWMTVERRDDRGAAVALLFNFEEAPVPLPFPSRAGSFRLALSTADPRYAGASGGGGDASEAPPPALEVKAETPLDVRCPPLTALVYVHG